MPEDKLLSLLRTMKETRDVYYQRIEHYMWEGVSDSDAMRQDMEKLKKSMDDAHTAFWNE